MARCPRCDAHNTDDAAWCSQCFLAFSGSPMAGGPSPAADVAAVPADFPPGPGVGAQVDDHVGALPHDAPAIDGPPGPVGGVHGREVRERDGEVEWHCAVCDTWNDLYDGRCAICGSRRVGFGAVGEEAAASPTAGSSAPPIVASSLLPGLGHLMAGRTGAGLARIAVFGLWLAGGVGWTLSGSGPTRPPGLVLLAGAALLWVATQIDIVSLVGPRRAEPLGNRGLLWLVVGVTVLLAASVAMLTIDVVSRT